MDWRSLIQLTDSWKLFTFDVEPAHEVETLTWTHENLWATPWNFSVGWVGGLFGNWVKPTITLDAIAAPDGTVTADALARSNLTACSDGAIIPATPGSTYTVSVWLKAGTATTCYLSLSSGLNGALNYPPIADDIVALTSTWQRFSLTATVPLSGANQIELGVGFESGTIGEYFYAWGAQIEEHATIESSGYPNLWSTPYTDGVPNRITEDGVEYLEAYSLAECDANAGSFYFDFQNQVLYVHTSGSDSPGKLSAGLPVYTVLVFFYRHFSNSAFEDDPVVFPRITKAIYNGGFETWYDDSQPYDWFSYVSGLSTTNVETTDVHSGAYCTRIDIDGSNSDAFVYKTIRLLPGAHCKLAVWYKNSLAGKVAGVSLVDTGVNTHLKDDGTWGAGAGWFDIPNATVWTKFTLEFDAPAIYTEFVVCLGNGTNATTSEIYFDDAQIEVFREDNPYLPLASTSMPDLHQSIQLFHLGTVTMEAGAAEFVNDGWWYEQLAKYWWHTKNIIIKMGGKGSSYDDMEQVFAGVISDISANELVAKLEIVDNKVLTYANINPNAFTVGDYTWLEDGAEGKPIPIIYGEFDEVVPTCINISSSPANGKQPWTYKVADHDLEDIPKIWKNGIQLTITTDYTLNLADGEFTLLANPYSGFITCSVKGKKCDRFRKLIAGTYSENVADILYDMLLDYSLADPDAIDMESMLDLKNSRSQKHHLYIAQDTQLFNAIRALQASALFHFIPKVDGKFGAYRFKTGTDANTIQIADEDIEGFGIQYNTEGVYKTIRLAYGFRPAESNYSELDITLDKIEWKHGRSDTLPIQTTLRGAGADIADVTELGNYYVGVLQDPIKMIVGTLPPVIFATRPGDKIIVTKTKKLDNGSTYSVLAQDPYRLMDLRKKIQNGKVEITAWDDLQSSGGSFCEVCYHCQVCNVTESGTCVGCYACQICVASECASCQVCYYCEHCVSGQCSSCQSCDTCQTCYSCQTAVGSVCPICEKCVSGQCSSCQHCNACERCYACMRDACGKTG